MKLEGVLPFSTRNTFNHKETFAKAVDHLFPGIPRIENTHALTAAQEILKNDSLLVVMNHSSKLDMFLAIHSLLVALDIDDTVNKSILMNEELTRKHNPNLQAQITQNFCSLWDITPLPVFLSYKGWSSEERKVKNSKTKQDTLSALSEPRNIVFLFPEGNIDRIVLEAKRGLREFISAGRGYTLPVTSNFHTYLGEPVMGKMPETLVVHYPISNAELAAASLNNEGQSASDFVLSTVASALPPYQRGFYTEMSSQLELEAQNTDDERIKNMKELQHVLYSYEVVPTEINHAIVDTRDKA